MRAQPAERLQGFQKTLQRDDFIGRQLQWLQQGRGEGKLRIGRLLRVLRHRARHARVIHVQHAHYLRERAIVHPRPRSAGRCGRGQLAIGRAYVWRKQARSQPRALAQTTASVSRSAASPPAGNPTVMASTAVAAHPVFPTVNLYTSLIPVLYAGINK